MKLREFFSGRDELLPKEQIIEQIRSSPAFVAAEEDVEKAEALLIFRTSRQQTWLVSCGFPTLKTSRSLDCRARANWIIFTFFAPSRRDWTACSWPGDCPSSVISWKEIRMRENGSTI